VSYCWKGEASAVGMCKQGHDAKNRKKKVNIRRET
jgi:hypothetical protein